MLEWILCVEGKNDEQTKCQRCKTQRVDFERQKKKKKKKNDGRQIRKCSLYTSGHSKRFTDKNNQTHNIHLLQSLEMHSCRPFCFLTSET